MKNSILLFLLIICRIAFAQKHDNNWILGYHGQNPHPLQNNMLINFNETSIEIIPLELDSGLYLNKTNASVSSSDGTLLFYTNGIYVANTEHKIIENGDSLNNFGVSNWYRETGLNTLQGALILPTPESDSLFYIFHEPVDFDPNGLGYYIPKLFYSIVDMSENDGMGRIIEKDITLLNDTLVSGRLTACKHANGRDWWIIAPEDDESNNAYYKLLLTPEGVSVIDKQAIPAPLYGVSSVGNAIFTPEGSKYIKHDIRFDPWNAVAIYDFDRCTGDLELIEQFEINDTTFLYGGAAVSPDSRYLYAVTNNIIYQFDLWAADIKSTKTVVAIYDGFIGLFFRTLFGTPQLAPDGSIWVASVSDTVMHVIRTPNQPGTASHVDQHAIHLPKINQKSIPNFPNYRLGPLDGSPCDTLGLDNHPQAGFTWFAEELVVTFSDNSYYRPEVWAWNFGEGSTSNERNPIHTYEEPGEYHVCVTVSNEYGSNTACNWVQVDTLLDSVSHVIALDIQRTITIHPNPTTTGRVNLAMSLPLPNVAVWSFYDVLGREVHSTQLPVGQQEAAVGLVGLVPGLYFWNVVSEKGTVGSGKLIIVK